MKDVLAKPIRSFLDGKMKTASSPAYLMSKAKFDKLSANGLVKEVTVGNTPPAPPAGEPSSALPADPASQPETASSSDGGEKAAAAADATPTPAQEPASRDTAAQPAADPASQPETATRKPRRSSSPTPASE
ncbi:MAG: hypothetical protein Q8L20_10795 [Gammaproteobacteria bacterium]|nr:hypothetical protein [Gammaproteobacteria bacterium]